nr:transporter [Paraburkholderia youngii]
MRCPPLFRTLLHAVPVVLVLLAARTQAQELEPRTYSASPVGTNFVVATYTYLTGDVLTTPSLPIANVEASINSVALGYVHTFGLFGNTASLGFLLPFASGNISGEVVDAPREIHRAGLGDLSLRFAYQFLGSPALSPQEFAKRTPTTSLGASLTVVAPTGQYVPYHLINIGANRWAFKPEFGISQPWDNWFAEVTAGIWFFADNRNFLGNNTRSQEPLATFQLHAGYNFRPGLNAERSERLWRQGQSMHSDEFVACLAPVKFFARAELRVYDLDPLAKGLLDAVLAQVQAQLVAVTEHRTKAAAPGKRHLLVPLIVVTSIGGHPATTPIARTRSHLADGLLTIFEAHGSRFHKDVVARRRSDLNATSRYHKSVSKLTLSPYL